MSSPEALANQIRREDKIQCRANHHTGMRELLRQLGRPRPEGHTASGKRPLYTLSLVNPDSEFAYDGYDYRENKHFSYRLSTNPDDYAWETFAENSSRKSYEVLTRGTETRKASGQYQSAEHRAVGRRSGLSRSPAKRKAAKRNFAKATHVRCHYDPGLIKEGCEFCEASQQ